MSTPANTSAAPATSSTPAAATPATASTVNAPASAETAAPAAAPANAAAVTPAVPNPPADAPKPTAAEVQRLKIKLEGQDIELPIEEVVKLAQMSASAQARWQAAAAEKKRAVDVLEFMKANPKETLKRLGIDIKKFSEDTLMEIIQQEQETPQAKELRETKEKIRAYEAQENERKAAEEARRVEAEKARIAAEQVRKNQEIIQKYDSLFTAALAKADVPKTAASVARMAQLQRINLKKGYQLDADKLAQVVSEDYQKELQSQLTANKTADGKLDGDKIMNYLGDAIIEAITKAKVAKLKSTKQKFTTPAEANAASAAVNTTNSNPHARGSWREFAKKARGARQF